MGSHGPLFFVLRFLAELKSAVLRMGEGEAGECQRIIRCWRVLNLSNRRVRTRMHGGVGGGGREANPYPDCLRHSAGAFRCPSWPELVRTNGAALPSDPQADGTLGPGVCPNLPGAFF